MDGNGDTLGGEITVEEFRRELDRRSREQLGMSADEFARRYRRGELPDSPDVNEIAILLALGDDALVPA